jgi:soluble lytic murein transglycosylase
MYRDSDGVLHLENKPSSSVKRKLLFREQHNFRNKSNDFGEIIGIIERISRQVGIDPALVRAVAYVESSFNPKAKSSKGAIGVMQLMPATAKRFNVKDIYDPEENIRGGALYLKYLLDLFDQNLEWTIAAYNAGEQTVIKAKGVPQITETRQFVERVLNFYSIFRKNGGKPVKKIVDENGRIILTNL